MNTIWITFNNIAGETYIERLNGIMKTPDKYYINGRNVTKNTYEDVVYKLKQIAANDLNMHLIQSNMA